jgi:basic membrane protein A and related proteins
MKNKWISKKLAPLATIGISILLFVSLIAGCSPAKQAVSNQENILNIGLVLGSGGLGDKSFNDSAYKGLLDAQKQYNIRFETVEPTSEEAKLNAIRLFARNNYDLIIGIAIENQNSIQTVSREFPRIKFGAIDFELTENNVASIVYREQEGDFLMGVLADLLTKSKFVGVIGGMDIPAIKRIMSGFKQGTAYQDNTVKVFADYAGTFSDPQVGLKLALSRYDEGADVIHNAASKTGLGIIEAAKQTHKLTTGTSGDQRYIAPGNVVGNRPKRVDTAVLMLIDEVKKGTFKPGVRSLGLKENGLTLGPFDETLVTRDMLNRLDELKQKIINGQIVIQAE